jgi:hypothetical protein
VEELEEDTPDSVMAQRERKRRSRPKPRSHMKRIAVFRAALGLASGEKRLLKEDERSTQCRPG